MNKIIEMLKSLFASKNIELTADETSKLYESILASAAEKKPLPEDLNLPDNLKHNAQIFTKYIESSQAQMEAMNKKQEESNAAYQTKIDELLKMLGEEKEKREQGHKAIEEQQQKDKAAKIEAIIAEAVTAGKIPAMNEDLKTKIKSILDTNLDDGKAFIDAIPGKTPTENKTIEGKNAGTKPERTALASVVNPAILARLDTQIPAN